MKDTMIGVDLAHDLQRAADEHEDIVTWLEHLIKELHHALYGKKSEKLAPDDRQLCFEDLEVAVAEVEEDQARPKLITRTSGFAAAKQGWPDTPV